jgi:hypothetical protein
MTQILGLITSILLMCFHLLYLWTKIQADQMVNWRPKTMKTMLVTVRGNSTPSKQDGRDDNVDVAFADSTGCDIDASPSASVKAAKLVGVRMEMSR